METKRLSHLVENLLAYSASPTSPDTNYSFERADVGVIFSDVQQAFESPSISVDSSSNRRLLPESRAQAAIASPCACCSATWWTTR